MTGEFQADPEPPAEAEVGPVSLWFLRGLTALVLGVVIWFAVDALPLV